MYIHYYIPIARIQLNILAFLRSNVQVERIKELFDLAVQRQTKEMNDNITGYGIDNHLMGLRYVAKEAGDQIPEIFRDEAYTIVNHFALSTSQVSMSDLFSSSSSTLLL